MLLRLVYLGLTNTFALLRMLTRTDQDKDTPIVIAGDLNTKYRHSQETIVQELTRRGYEDAFEGRNERTHFLIGSLDYIFVRGPIRITDAKVHRNMHGSDHFAISARLLSTAQVAVR